MKKEYDLIFGVGQGCSCTESLRGSNLQVFSYPFDWLFGTDIIGRVELLCEDFAHFIDKDDLSYSYKDKQIQTHAYTNNRTGITFNHDFLAAVPFDEMYKMVREKYDRRCTRLLRQIKSAKSVLIVYVELPLEKNKLKDDRILALCLDKLKAKYSGKNIELLYFICDLNFAPLKYEQSKVRADITKVIGNYRLGGGGGRYPLI